MVPIKQRHIAFTLIIIESRSFLIAPVKVDITPLEEVYNKNLPLSLKAREDQ
ncbi:MAG: hypothetical protein P8Q41_16910 [Saprospiraceae bacterium]|nr:hypothetical protein [Saprospiraceae bacterium]